MTNHIVGVASLLGVKVGEVFHIENDSSLNGCVFRFSENDLQVSKANGDNDTWRVANDSRLLGLLYGNLSIHKLPWKPKMRENYYTPSLGCKDSLFLWTSAMWVNDKFDREFYKQGLVCKTAEEATQLANKMLTAAQEVRKND